MDDEIAPTNPPSTDKSDGMALTMAQTIPEDDLVKENEMFVIKKLEHHSSSNGKDEEITIHRQQTVCADCWELIKKDSHVWHVQCKCTTISLIHHNCKDAWFQKHNGTCGHCDEKIVFTGVVVSSQISGENPSTPMPKGSRWRFKGKN